jgi:signal peptidase I
MKAFIALLLAVILFQPSCYTKRAEDASNAIGYTRAVNETTEIADKLYYEGQYEKAIPLYLKSLSPKDPEMLVRIALCYFLTGKYESAQDYMIEAAAINPEIVRGRAFRIPKAGMEPTLIVGDHIFVDPNYYLHNEIRRGDVIVFKYPVDKTKLFVKRVIGLPNENIMLVNKNVLIDSVEYRDNKAIYKDAKISAERDNFGPVRVPESKYFVLGDNRDESYDSRFWGFVDKSEIIGRVMAVYVSAPGKDLTKVRPERVGSVE